jgi:hypothetical protein
MHMNMFFFFQNLNILCIFSDRFFDPVPVRFRFFGSTGSMTSLVLVTLLKTLIYILNWFSLRGFYSRSC